MKIFHIPAFTDNYIWCIQKNKKLAVVDPGDSKELLNLYEQGKLKIPYPIEEGIENFPLALQKLFAGGNTGKLMVKA